MCALACDVWMCAGVNVCVGGCLSGAFVNVCVCVCMLCSSAPADTSSWGVACCAVFSIAYMYMYFCSSVVMVPEGCEYHQFTQLDPLL